MITKQPAMKNALLYSSEVSHLFKLPIIPIAIPAKMGCKTASPHILIMAIMTGLFVWVFSISIQANSLKSPSDWISLLQKNITDELPSLPAFDGTQKYVYCWLILVIILVINHPEIAPISLI